MKKIIATISLVAATMHAENIVYYDKSGSDSIVFKPYHPIDEKTFKPYHPNIDIVIHPVQ